MVQAEGNTNNGSADWTYSVPDSAFDFLADGEILTLTYTATVNDGHGGIATKPLTVTVTGTNDAVAISSAPQIGAITEITGAHNSSTPDSATGTIAFTDVDWTDTHAVTIVGSVGVSGVATGLANGTVQLTWLTLGALTDCSGGLTGTQKWTFSAPDHYFDYLADSEAVTLTYTVQVDDHHGGLTSKDVVVTVTGTNDAPTLAAENAGKLTDTAANDIFGDLTGTLDGSDVDHGETASLTYAALDGSSAVNTAVAGLYGSLTVNANGTYTYVPNAAAINALHDGSYTDTFTVQTTDVHGATGTAVLTVEVTGANDTPSIVGEVNPSVQIIGVSAPTSPHVLAAGVNVNSLGLNTETFDDQTANGAGRGNFHSDALGADFRLPAMLELLLVPGRSGRPRLSDRHLDTRDTTKYLSILGNATETITFSSEKNTFGLYWGSVDFLQFHQVLRRNDSRCFLYRRRYQPAVSAPATRVRLHLEWVRLEFTGLHAFNKVVLAEQFERIRSIRQHLPAADIVRSILKPVTEYARTSTTLTSATRRTAS